MTWKDRIKEVYSNVMFNKQPTYKVWKFIGSERIDELEYLSTQNEELAKACGRVLGTVVENVDKVIGFYVIFNHLGYEFRITVKDSEIVPKIVEDLLKNNDNDFEIYVGSSEKDVLGYIALPEGKYQRRIMRIRELLEKVKISRLSILPCVFTIWGVPRSKDGNIIREVVRLIVEPYKYSYIGLSTRKASLKATYDQFMKLLNDIDFEGEDNIEVRIVDEKNNSLYNYIGNYDTINDETMKHLVNILSTHRVYFAHVEKYGENIRMKVSGNKEEVKRIYESIRQYIVKEECVQEGYFDVIVKEDVASVAMSQVPQIEIKCPKCGFYARIESSHPELFRLPVCPICGMSMFDDAYEGDEKDNLDEVFRSLGCEYEDEEDC